MILESTHPPPVKQNLGRQRPKPTKPTPSSQSATWAVTKNVRIKDTIDSSGPKFESTNFLFAAAIMRFSVIVVTFFLVQILIGLYRYNTRLVTFYVSRRDAILLAGEDIGNREQIVEFLTPKNVNFGKVSGFSIIELVAMFLERRGASSPNSDAKDPKEERKETT